jgi:glycosyltransferase involved in cell wall biosynthesis
VEFFLEAAVRIKQGYNNVVFIVVGGSFPAKDNRLIELRERVFFLGMDEDFIFTGFQENVREFISVFDVAVNVTDKEACSRAMMEYMACGKAVVAMEDGGSPELITSGENGILTHPLKIGDFADAVTGLLKDEQKRGNLGRKARAAAELKFDIKKNVLKTQNIYLELIEKK